ncbi:unnamed protein product, partial [Meganyctiphanes norvegica]
IKTAVYGKSSHICEYCRKDFRRLSKLKRHTVVHTREKPFECTLCDKKFSQVSNRERHMLDGHLEIKSILSHSEESKNQISLTYQNSNVYDSNLRSGNVLQRSFSADGEGKSALNKKSKSDMEFEKSHKKLLKKRNEISVQT